MIDDSMFKKVLKPTQLSEIERKRLEKIKQQEKKK
jgi:hypothetical protein